MRPRHQDVLLLSGRDDVRAGIQDSFVGEPFRFHLTEDAGECVQVVEQKGCRLAVLDLQSLNGVESVRDLRSKLPLNTSVLIVGVTNREDIATLARDGAHHVFPEPLDQLQLRLVLRNAAEKAALSEENLTLREELRRSKSLIMRDDLTSAYNRRYFDTFLEEEIERSRRFSSPVSLIFMDLDDLKQVNSRYGHAMGSLALKEAAIRIIDTVRSIDKVVRWGGDEFCIILPETDWRGAKEVAERIRERFAGGEFLVEKTGGVGLTASFGISSFPEHANTKSEMVRKADEAMFQIKGQQKNGILVTQEALEEASMDEEQGN